MSFLITSFLPGIRPTAGFNSPSNFISCPVWLALELPHYSKADESFSNFAFITLLLIMLCQISLLKTPTCNIFNQQPKRATGTTPCKSIRDFTRTSALKSFHYTKIVVLIPRLFEDLSRLLSCLLPLVQLWSLLSHASYWTNEKRKEINFVTKFIFALWIQIPNINKQIPVEKYQSLTMKTFIII